MTDTPLPTAFYDAAPYKDAFDILYPQESYDGDIHKYSCKSCKVPTTDINGRLENHAPQCACRLGRIAESA